MQGDALTGWLRTLADDIGAPRVPASGAAIVSVVGNAIRAGLAVAAIGDLCQLTAPDGRDAGLAEVVAVDTAGATLLPYGSADGLTRAHQVRRIDGGNQVVVGDALLGRVLDGMGRPMATTAGAIEPIATTSVVPLLRPAPNPLTRLPVDQPLGTGVKAIDATLTMGRGQRVGIFAAAGMGKTSLLGMLARGADAEICVIALIGERGREVREFLELEISAEWRRRCVLVVAGAERPAVERRRAAYVATAIAEHFRSQGRQVLLIMDSLTRFARAMREIGLAAGEPPTRRGYPPSVFAQLPQLLERAGNDEKGSMTAIYTVLVEGDDMNEPVADEVRSLLDGHIVLSSTLAAAGQYPAIDVLRSVSRVMHRVATDAHQAHARQIRTLLAKHAEIALLVSLGEYKRGHDALGDEALDRLGAIRAFLAQARGDSVGYDDAVDALETVFCA